MKPKQRGYFLVAFTFLYSLCFGQVVWTEPAFASQADDIVLYFDASQGNGALADYAGDVYAHTGVITSASTSPTDWQHVQGNWGVADSKVLMQSEGNDIYSLSYNITDYYGINPGEIVDQLAFVFRNVDGSLVGRASDGADIYLDIYPEDQNLAVNIVSPVDNSNVLISGESIPIKLETNIKAYVEVEVDGVMIFQDSITQLDIAHQSLQVGNHSIQITVSTQDSSIMNLRKFVTLDDTYPAINISEELVGGINYLDNGRVGFKLTAPNKQNVFFLCPVNQYSPDIDYRMGSNGMGDFYIEFDPFIFSNGNNNYQYLIDANLIDDKVKIADPFSRVVLDPWNDDEIEPAVLGLYGSYPSDYTTGIVTAFDLGPDDFMWTDQNFVKPDKGNLVIYEILLRDFLEDHSFRSLTDTLDYLQDLGVTAIELMPINEFEGNNSWGYNPSYHMAVDKYYGSKTDLKRLINECHARGIAVINDVVFNHAFSQSPLCQMYWNSADFRPASDSPYLNEVARHPFNVGYDFNHESQYTKAWVKQVLSYWQDEFHFDGFRFDLSKGLTQTNSGSNSGLMSQYDQSRIDILKEYSDHIWAKDNTAYMICEHFAENAEETVLSDYGMMLWGNVTYQFAEAAMGYSSGLSAASYKSKGWSEPNLIAYAESHDEERLGYKIKTWGNGTSSYNTKDTWTFAERIVATNLIYLSIPGPKMLWQFGELGYDYSINTCENGSINDNCRLSPKPIRWDYAEQAARALMNDKIGAILKVRDELDVFKTTDFDLTSDAFTKRVILNGTDVSALSIANFDLLKKPINPKFPSVGTWYEFFTGEVLEVIDTEAVLEFEPGEYRMYFTQPYSPEGGFYSSTHNISSTSTSLSPNPVHVGSVIDWCPDTSAEVLAIRAIGLDGKPHHLKWSRNTDCLQIESSNLQTGYYIIDISTDAGSYHSALIVID